MVRIENILLVIETCIFDVLLLLYWKIVSYFIFSDGISGFKLKFGNDGTGIFLFDFTSVVLFVVMTFSVCLK